MDSGVRRLRIPVLSFDLRLFGILNNTKMLFVFYKAERKAIASFTSERLFPFYSTRLDSELAFEMWPDRDTLLRCLNIAACNLIKSNGEIVNSRRLFDL